MNNKLLVLFSAICAVLLTWQTASSQIIDRELPDELYILNPDSIFPIIVTDPNSPLLNTDSRQIIYVCHVQRCQQRCRSWGYRYGRCNIQAICVCSNR